MSKKAPTLVDTLYRETFARRTYFGNSRTTFIIDGDGVVAHVIPKVKPETHDDEVLAAIAAL